MTELGFLLLLSVFSSVMLYFGFRVLPHDGWQMLATLPIRLQENGQWQGLNLTWYGLLTANAYLAALAMLIILLGAAEVPLGGVLLLALLLLGLCVPASRLVARIVEGKAHTFTVGGAVFVGIVATPWLILLVNYLTAYQLPVLTTLAAIGIAYAFGEGLGRLACISFGCCYGKPLSACSPLLRRIFKHFNFTFCGDTRKIAYADNLAGIPTLPVQALTSMLYVGTGLVGTALFLAGQSASVFVLIILVTQGWRVLSEMLRADHRGTGKISAYQIMSLLAIPYALVSAIIFATSAGHPVHLMLGLQNLWQPEILILLQCVWLVMFLYTGRSMVTGANLSFHVHTERI
ncbi:MAG: prolipoprotein diacylglyceryl transferase [Deltaproteobacteria bacterium]|nr:prolipoprotein diacylglyceryl transferase [Deltaproteobacteria bacterium]